MYCHGKNSETIKMRKLNRLFYKYSLLIQYCHRPVEGVLNCQSALTGTVSAITLMRLSGSTGGS